MTRSVEILERLIGFKSISAESNLPLIEYVEEILRPAGFELHRITSRNGKKAGLFAVLGSGSGGVMFSGHTDVVPVEGQAWSSDPFKLRKEGERLYGRGTADMKGYLASMLAAAEGASKSSLRTPFKLALSYDEEIGCVGIAEMLPHLEGTIGLPDLCLVGEPTSMRLALGHKGKIGMRATCRGEAGHSAFAPRLRNALHPAVELIMQLRRIQEELANNGSQDSAYGVPYSTLHAGKLSGGVALNVVPDVAVMDFELRYLAQDDEKAICDSIRDAADKIGKGHIELEEFCSYPGLDTASASPAASFVRELLPNAETTKVDFGSEAGYFDKLGISTLVCGPGSMEQGHKPDEFVTLKQMSLCDSMFAAALRKMCE